MDKNCPWLRPSPTTGHKRMTQLVGRRRKHTPPLATGLMARVAHSLSLVGLSPGAHRRLGRVLICLDLLRTFRTFSFLPLP